MLAMGNQRLPMYVCSIRVPPLFRSSVGLVPQTPFPAKTALFFQQPVPSRRGHSRLRGLPRPMSQKLPSFLVLGLFEGRGREATKKPATEGDENASTVFYSFCSLSCGLFSSGHLLSLVSRSLRQPRTEVITLSRCPGGGPGGRPWGWGGPFISATTRRRPCVP